MERNQQELQLELARVREQLDVVAVQLAKAWERQLPPDGHSDQQVGRALDVLLEVASAQGAAARIHALRDKLTEKAMTMTMGQLQLADNTKDRKLADAIHQLKVFEGLDMPVFRRIGGADKKMALVELLRIIANELTSENIKMMDDEAWRLVKKLRWMKSGEQQGQMGKKEDEVFLHFFLALEKIVAAKYNLLYEWVLMAAVDADDHENVFVITPREPGAEPKYVVKRTAVGRLTPWQWQDDWNRVSVEYTTSREAWSVAPALFVETVEAFGTTGADGITTYNMVMEFIERGTVGGLIRKRQGQIPPVIVSIFAQTMRCLSTIHQNKIGHKDLSPGNLFVAEMTEMNGQLTHVRIKLGDFGLAEKHLSAIKPALQFRCGTPFYKAPEMVGFVATRSEARPVSYKADTYSAAAIFWKLLSGETPPERHYFDAHTGLPRFVRVEVLRRLPASDQLFGILQKSLALEPNNRANSGQIAAFIADYAAKLQQKQF